MSRVYAISLEVDQSEFEYPVETTCSLDVSKEECGRGSCRMPCFIRSHNPARIKDRKGIVGIIPDSGLVLMVIYPF